jgi:pimeloyl-ACP methyl ester carboxylesterase
MRLLRGLRVAADVVEAKEFAVVLRALVGPAALHDVERFVAPRPAALERHAEELDLVAQPADARAHDDPPAREIVERIAGARLLVIPEVGHQPFQEVPADYNRLLNEFWS